MADTRALDEKVSPIMRSPKLLACLLALSALGLGGCGRRTEVKMIDPRTGAVAFCASGQYAVSAQPEALYPLQACLNELSYYGFRDEDWLRRVAARAPAAPVSQAPLLQAPVSSAPVSQAPMSQAPQSWVPAGGVGGPSSPTYDARPMYANPVSPGY